MSSSLTAVCIWVIVAGVISMLPSKRAHWPAAYVLIAVGIPILAYVFYQMGPLWGLGTLVVGMMVLRWPVIYLVRWCVRQLGVKRS